MYYSVFRFFININKSINYSIWFIINYNILFFEFLLVLIISSDVLLSINFFLFKLNYLIGSINDPKSLVNYLSKLRLFRFFYLYKSSYIFYHTIKIYFQAIKVKIKIYSFIYYYHYHSSNKKLRPWFILKRLSFVMSS